MRKRTQPEVSLSEMRTLVAALEAGTFTAAAKRLGVTQPAVSRQLIKLEGRMGVALFEREGRHLRLTPPGERFLAYARDMLSGFDEMMSDIRMDNVGPAGELRIGASTTFCDYVVLEWVQDFCASNPDVLPYVFMSDSDAVEEDIIDGEADLGFIGRLPRTSSVRFHAVADDEVVLAVPANHRFASRREITLDELRDQPFITRDRASTTAGTVAATLHELGLEEPERRVVMTLNSAPACLRAVSRGLGVSWVSNLPFLRGDVPGVVPIRVRGITFTRKLYLVHARRSLTPLARTFITWLLDERPQKEPAEVGAAH